MKYYLFISLLFLPAMPSLAQPDAVAILQKTRNFYQAKNIGELRLQCWFKSSIAETIDSYELNFAWCRNMNLFASWTGENKTVELLYGKKIYSLRRDQKTVRDISLFREEKISSARKYPFYDNKFLSVLLKKKWHVVENDSSYQFFDNGISFVINKRNYALTGYQDLALTEFGMQLFEWKLLEQQYPDHLEETVIPLLLNNLRNFRKVSSDSSTRNPDWKEKNVKHLLPDSFFLKGGYILLDFFYQSCMPCIASFPNLKALQNKIPDEKLIIKGIDFVSDDSLTMNVFKKRYGLSYDVITGEKARKLNEIFNPEHVYPFYLLIDARGCVEDVQEGLDEKFFEKVRRLVFSHK